MWQRAELKTNAKSVLKGNYWKAFFVSLLIILSGGSHNHLELGGSTGGSGGPEPGNLFNFEIVLLIVVVSILFIISLRIFLGYALEVGGRKYFIKLSAGESDFSYTGSFFRKNKYKYILLPMLLRSIYIFLWSLLLIIPGIIKMYTYRMVPYILAENPEIGHKKALEISKEMTKGEKWNIFVLDLSFLGWFILGALLLGIGVLFVQPYYDATNAELYLKLKRKAVNFST